MALADVFAALQAARDGGVLSRYAIGGAVGAAVYIEPSATEDVDVFVTLEPPTGGGIVTLEAVYAFFRARGAEVEAERLAFGGWLVQLLPPPTTLVEDALQRAVSYEVEGVSVPVFSMEHLAAICLETGRLKDKVRLEQFLDSPRFDREGFLALVARFGLDERWRRVQEFFRENQ
jgi:hypothetical protein